MSSSSKSTIDTSNKIEMPLANRLSQHILEYNTKFNGKNAVQSPLFQATIALAGGGSCALSAITSTPGASSFLLEGAITYDRNSYANFLASPSTIKNGELSNTTAFDSVPRDFKFSSRLAAQHLAHASLKKSLQYVLSKANSPSSCCNTMNQVYQNMDHCIGVGCSSMLSSTPGTRKSEQLPHGHVCIMHPDGSMDEITCNINTGAKIHHDPYFLRKDQDEKLSCVVLLSILTSMRKKIVQCVEHNKIDMEGGQSALQHLNDIIQEAVSNLTNDGEIQLDMSDLVFTPSPPDVKPSKFSSENEIVTEKANEILLGKKSANILLPLIDLPQNGNDNAYTSFQDTVLPTDCLIFPGSFNPIHTGHITLAHAALKVMTEKRQKEFQEERLLTTNSNVENENISVWDAALRIHKYKADPPLPPPPTIFFEMSIANADKDPMDIAQVEQRSRWILEEMMKLTSKDNTGDPINIPSWGVLLDSAPLFFQKVHLIQNLICSFHPSTRDKSRNMTFVIGTDTLVRLLDIKYYDNNVENMLSAIREMKTCGVHFVVGGRSEQGSKSNTEDSVPQFIDGSKELAEQPQDIQDMFTLIKEEDFRVDMSSTEIRKQRGLP